MRLVILLALLAIPELYADVTLRYKAEVKLNPSLPNAAAGMKAMDTAMPAETLLQFKNGKGFTSQGAMTSIYDFSKGEITLLDREGKRYATLPAGQFQDAIAAAMPQMPKEARAMLDSIKTHAESKATGRTATIYGVEAEEREIVITTEVPSMPNLPAPAGPMMRMVIHCWSAKAGEVMRVPAIRELAGYNLFAIATMNPLSSIEKMMPMAKDIASMMKEMQSGGTPVVLRVQFDMFMPMIGAMLKQAPAGKAPFGANFDPDAPFMQMNQEVAELSSAPVADSVFEIPKDYASASATEIMKDIIQKKQDAVRKAQETK